MTVFKKRTFKKNDCFKKRSFRFSIFLDVFLTKRSFLFLIKTLTSLFVIFLKKDYFHKEIVYNKFHAHALIKAKEPDELNLSTLNK